MTGGGGGGGVSRVSVQTIRLGLGASRAAPGIRQVPSEHIELQPRGRTGQAQTSAGILGPPISPGAPRPQAFPPPRPPSRQGHIPGSSPAGAPTSASGHRCWPRWSCWSPAALCACSGRGRERGRGGDGGRGRGGRKVTGQEQEQGSGVAAAQVNRSGRTSRRTRGTREQPREGMRVRGPEGRTDTPTDGEGRDRGEGGGRERQG